MLNKMEEVYTSGSRFRAVGVYESDRNLELLLFGHTLYWYRRGHYHNRCKLSRNQDAPARLNGPPSVVSNFERNENWIFISIQ